MEITADILRIAKKGARKTHLVYQANLNFQLINTYLKRLISVGLVKETTGRHHVYQTTEKGKAYLDQYQAFKDRFDA